MMMNNSSEPSVVLVDIHDNPIGTAPKSLAHATPRLHRAFSVFLYDGDRMMIQQRAEGKYHSGGLWSNSCCSHPRPHEELDEAVQARLLEELGITVPVEKVFEYTYFNRFHDAMYEYEYDHVFIGQYSGEFTLNPDEAQSMRWILLDELEHELVVSPERYSVWLVGTAARVIDAIRKRGN